MNISEVNRLAIYRHSLGRPKYIAIYRIHSAGLQHFIAMHCWIIFNEYHTAEKATIYICILFQHHLSLLLSAATTHTKKQYPATNPQPTITLTRWLWRAFWSQILLKLHNAISETYRHRQYIGTGKNISFINISAIYRDWLHSLCTHSAGKFMRVPSTSGHVCLLFDKL